MNVKDLDTLGIAIHNLVESPQWRIVEELVRTLESGTPVGRAQIVIEAVQHRMRVATSTTTTPLGDYHLRT